MNVSTFLAIAGPVSGLLIALVGGLFAMNTQRASAAKMYTEASVTVLEELAKVRAENRLMRGAIGELVDVIRKDVVPIIEGEHPGVVHKLELVKERAEAAI